MLDSQFIIPGSAGDKDNAFPRFYPKSKKLEYRSAQEGQPVFETRHYVEIITPGDTRSIPNREVTDADKARWPREWAAYVENRELTPEGTPLEQWPLIDVGQIDHLKVFRIRSVEQLSQVSDNQLPNLGMGARSLRDKAIAWLAQARGGSGIAKIVAERDMLKSKVDALEGQIADLAALVKARPATTEAAPAPGGDMLAMLMQQMQAMQARLDEQPAKAKPGRKPKVVEETHAEQAD
jgi:hypothetical protein